MQQVLWDFPAPVRGCVCVCVRGGQGGGVNSVSITELNHMH